MTTLPASRSKGGPGSDRLDAPTVSYADTTEPFRIDGTRQAAEDQLSDAVVNVTAAASTTS